MYKPLDESDLWHLPAWTEGYGAYNAWLTAGGIPPQNPHEPVTKTYYAWKGGWLNAELDYMLLTTIG